MDEKIFNKELKVKKYRIKYELLKLVIGIILVLPITAICIGFYLYILILSPIALISTILCIMTFTGIYLVKKWNDNSWKYEYSSYEIWKKFNEQDEALLAKNKGEKK